MPADNLRALIGSMPPRDRDHVLDLLGRFEEDLRHIAFVIAKHSQPRRAEGESDAR